jgi:argininosuccinate lyase
MVRSLTINATRARAALKEGFVTATDLADYLARKGLPFREAHEVVGKAVAHAEDKSIGLEELHLHTLKSFSPLVEEDVFECLTPEASLSVRRATGGPAPENVRAEAKLAITRLDALWPRRG